jgi:hypothetical protein
VAAVVVPTTKKKVSPPPNNLSTHNYGTCSLVRSLARSLTRQRRASHAKRSLVPSNIKL